MEVRGVVGDGGGGGDGRVTGMVWGRGRYGAEVVRRPGSMGAWRRRRRAPLVPRLAAGSWVERLRGLGLRVQEGRLACGDAALRG